MISVMPPPPRTININTLVRVELTAAGRRMWRAYYEPAAALARVSLEPPPAEFPLWELMAIFGPHIHHGMTELPFVHNAITIS